MSTRTLITTIAVIAAFLAFPVIASAVPVSDPIAVSATAQPSPPASPDAGGADAITVVLVGGLTLLFGAAAGFEGARVMQRRGRAVQA